MGAQRFWDAEHTYRLAKDQEAVITVLKPDPKAEHPRKSLLRFRWTLYRNHRLIVLVRYDGFPTQYVLERGYRRDAIRIYLRDDYLRGDKRSYLLIRFDAFDPKRYVATLSTLLWDPRKRVEVRFQKRKGSR